MSARILIVDDNPLNAKLAACILEQAGLLVQTAADATQTLTLLERYRPDLILMDLGLPGMDGLTLTRHIKADSRFSDLRIVAFSAFAMESDAAESLVCGCIGYITKPIETRAFAGQVRQFLQPTPA
ncbi:MAG TPA: response regulator [Steroidobacteraceae bacterium]|nr:response regulator [Steroidobacteraceae bacterium]